MVHKIKNLSKKDYTVIMTTHMPDHAMMIGGKTAILGRDGTLKVGKTEEIITEKKLEELYQVKTVRIPVKMTAEDTEIKSTESSKKSASKTK